MPATYRQVHPGQKLPEPTPRYFAAVFLAHLVVAKASQVPVIELIRGQVHYSTNPLFRESVGMRALTRADPNTIVKLVHFRHTVHFSRAWLLPGNY